MYRLWSRSLVVINGHRLMLISHANVSSILIRWTWLRRRILEDNVWALNRWRAKAEGRLEIRPQNLAGCRSSAQRSRKSLYSFTSEWKMYKADSPSCHCQWIVIEQLLQSSFKYELPDNEPNSHNSISWRASLAICNKQACWSPGYSWSDMASFAMESSQLIHMDSPSTSWFHQAIQRREWWNLGNCDWC